MGMNTNGKHILFSVFVVVFSLFGCAIAKTEVLNIGCRRELFVDDYLIERLDGVELELHHPRKMPLSERPPAEGGYATIIKDGDIYRRYYRSYIGDASKRYSFDKEVTCYEQSRDGVNWTAPDLGLYDIPGVEKGNVILADMAPYAHNFSPFLDRRPGVSPEQRYKALGGFNTRKEPGKGGLVPFVSGDGIHWKKLVDKAVVKCKVYCFDSQNVSFWSESEQCYVCYFRYWIRDQKQRSIARAVSQDFIHWSEAVAMNPNIGDEHLYTNNTHPYFGARHIYISLPTRFMPGRDGSTDIMFMTSRGGDRYDRTFKEAFMRPGLDPERWGNRSNYVALNVVPTGPAEMSIYHNGSGRRYVLRTDGFVSVHAGYKEGEMVTRPLKFEGKKLEINFSTSAAGSIRVEIQDSGGEPIDGFTQADCGEIIGDKIAYTVSWKGGEDVSLSLK